LNRLNAAIILTQNWPDDFEEVYNCLPEWLFILVLSGAPRRPEEKYEYEEEALGEIITQFPRIVKVETSVAGLPGVEYRLPTMLRNPWPEGETYWKHRLKGGSQDLFFLTKLEYAADFVQTMNQLASEVAFPVDEIGGHIQPIEQGRACRVEFNLYYDPDDPAEVACVRQLYERAAKQFLNMDALFTEPYGTLADLVYEKANSYTTAMKKIKDLFDPNNIMCPGNLCF
jgi:FAD/FMN-containing dehydrogenase